MAVLDYLVKAIYALSILYAIKYVVHSILVAYRGPLSKIPGPFWYKFSHLPYIIISLRGESFSRVRELHVKYGNIVRTGPYVVSIADRDSVKKVLQEWDLPKSPVYDRFAIDDGIHTLFTERNRARYRQKRRLLSPGFSISYLNAQEDLLHDCSNVLIEVLDESCQRDSNGRAVVDMWTMLAELAVDMVTASAFGGSFNLVRNKEHELRSLTQQFFKKQNIYGLFGFLKYLPGSKERRRNPKLYAMLDEILQRRATAEKKLQKKDLLQIFIDAHEEDPTGYTWDHVKAEMLLFLVAGSETTSSTLTFALLKLVQDHRVRDLLVNELDSAFPNRNDAITTSKTKELPYLNAVINETMRLMPAAANGAPRITDRTIVLNDYVIPPQTGVSAHFYSLHHSPEVWGPDFEKFRPERWIEPGGDELLRSGMFPFSTGSRNCIGKNFAMMELQLILASLIRKYEIEEIPDQDLDLKCPFVLIFKSGRYDVAIKRRD